MYSSNSGLQNKKQAKRRSGVRIWDRKIAGPLCCVDFSPRDHWAALGFDDGGIQLIDETGNKRWEINIDSPILDIKIMEGKKRIVVLDERGRLSCFLFSGKKFFAKFFSQKYCAFEARPDGFFLWGWNANLLYVDSRGKSKGKINIPRPLAELKSIQRKKQFFVVHDSFNIGLYDNNGMALWNVTHPVHMDFSEHGAVDIDVSDHGGSIAVSGHEKGVFIYNARDFSLRNVELEKPVSRVAVSRNGDYFLFADIGGKLYLVSGDDLVLWQHTLKEKALYCRLDKEGTRALVVEKGGVLSSFEFYDGDEERGDFLELKKFNFVEEKKEIWKQKLAASGPFAGDLCISGGGERLLLNIRKRYTLYDANGNSIWNKTFMSLFDEARLSHDGDVVFLKSENDIYIRNCRLGKEKRLTFYGRGLKMAVFDAEKGNFLLLEKSGEMSLFDSLGQRVWKTDLKKLPSSIRMKGNKGLAALQMSNTTVYIINLKTLKVKQGNVDEPFSKMCIGSTGVFVGGAQGKVYALGMNGKQMWEFDAKVSIQNMSAVKGKVIILGTGRAMWVLNEKGVVLHEGKLTQSGSQLNFGSQAFLEVIADDKIVSCYNLKSREAIWKIRVEDEVKKVAVSPMGDRLGILGGENLYYHYLMKKPDLVDDRSSFLEF